MKLTSKIYQIAQALVVSCSLASCNYLDVIPPAQPDFDDTMKDEEATMNFLYSCYVGVPRSHPFQVAAFEQSADEKVAPPEYSNWQQQVAWGTISPSTDCGNSDDMNIWNASYNNLGYVHHFLSLIDEQNPAGVTAADKEQYKAECYFLEAYYHFRVLQAFGPCSIIPTKVDPNITNSEIPGRSHFDYCVDYIVRKLEDAATVLPPNREDNRELGRATSTICKALKARVLLYAASPLWNGSFPFPDWKNINYETPEYGKELVSLNRDDKKWERALTACQEALAAALGAGHDLFDMASADAKATLDKVSLPFIPGKEADTPENEKFKKRVRMFQYLITAHEGDGNKELIWGQRTSTDGNNSGEATESRLPNKVVKRSSGVYMGGWSSHAPTLYAVQHFYTEDGKLPNKDLNYYNQTEWYTRYYGGTQSPELVTNELDKEEVKNDIIKLNVGREARFYAWIAFDGGQYSTKINDGGPLWLNFKNTNTNGWNSSNTRNYAGTGYLSKKFVDPNITYSKDGSRSFTAIRTPFIRMAELYLNLAECYDALGQTGEALENLNKIRNRAGFENLTEADITADMTSTDWVRNERFVELYEEGHRYYDLRRWTIAPDMLKAGTRLSLNGMNITNPSFENFNTPIQINQPFAWDDRLYFLPVWSGNGIDELYSNPQMVQAPNY